MFCVECGTKFPEGAQFCPGCGTARTKSANAMAPSGNADIHADYVEYMALPAGPAREQFMRDKAGSIPRYIAAAEADDAEACFLAGRAYDVGVSGYEKNDVEAAKWYRKAAGQGNAVCQFNLGNMYADGRGMAQDEAEAVKWYRKSAEQGHAKAQANLAFAQFNLGLQEIWADLEKK